MRMEGLEVFTSIMEEYMYSDYMDPAPQEVLTHEDSVAEPSVLCQDIVLNLVDGLPVFPPAPPPPLQAVPLPPTNPPLHADAFDDQHRTFFQPISFYDDDDESFSLFDPGPLDLPFLEPILGCSIPPGQETLETVAAILEQILDKVVATATPPRKVATVYPFYAESTPDAVEPVQNVVPTQSVSTAGPDPRPLLKLANFAVDPGGSSGEPQPRLKLANFAVDPSPNQQYGSSSEVAGNLAGQDAPQNTGYSSSSAPQDSYSSAGSQNIYNNSGGPQHSYNSSTGPQHSYNSNTVPQHSYNSSGSQDVYNTNREQQDGYHGAGRQDIYVVGHTSGHGDVNGQDGVLDRHDGGQLIHVHARHHGQMGGQMQAGVGVQNTGGNQSQALAAHGDRFPKPYPPQVQDARHCAQNPRSLTLLSRAPSPLISGGAVSPRVHGGANSPAISGGVPSPSIQQPTPPPQSSSVACFGHFERELEYRYCFRTSDCHVFNGYVIFSSLDNVYVKLFVHETGLQGLPRNPLTWQSVYLKFESEPHCTWCFLTFRVLQQDKTTQPITVQAEVPLDYTHFSTLIQRKMMFVLSQTRLNSLNQECLNMFQSDISPSFYHVQKPLKYLRTNINNLGNECINPNISSENRQTAVKWINNQLLKHTNRNLPGRSSHIENQVYERFSRNGQFLFRFIHQYYAEIRKQIAAFINQSRKEPQIFELLDPQSGMGKNPAMAGMMGSSHQMSRSPGLQNSRGPFSPASSTNQSVFSSPNSSNQSVFSSSNVNQSAFSHASSTNQSNIPNLPKLPPGITIQPQRQSSPAVSDLGGVVIKKEKVDTECFGMKVEEESRSLSNLSHLTTQAQKLTIFNNGQISITSLGNQQQPPQQQQQFSPHAGQQLHSQIQVVQPQQGHAGQPAVHQQLQQHQQARFPPQVGSVQYQTQQQLQEQQYIQLQLQQRQQQFNTHYQQQQQIKQQQEQQRRIREHQEREKKLKEQQLRIQQERYREQQQRLMQQMQAEEERRKQEQLMALKKKQQEEAMLKQQQQIAFARQKMERERQMLLQRQQLQQQAFQQERENQRLRQERENYEKMIMQQRQEQLRHQEIQLQQHMQADAVEQKYSDVLQQQMQVQQQREQQHQMLQQREQQQLQIQQQRELHQVQMQQQREQIQQREQQRHIQQEQEQNQHELKYSEILQQQEKQQQVPVQSTEPQLNTQVEQKYSEVLRQQQEQQHQQQQEQLQQQTAEEEHPYYRYTQQLYQQEEPLDSGQEQQVSEQPQHQSSCMYEQTSAVEQKYSHVLQQEAEKESLAAETSSTADQQQLASCQYTSEPIPPPAVNVKEERMERQSCQFANSEEAAGSAVVAVAAGSTAAAAELPGRQPSVDVDPQVRIKEEKTDISDVPTPRTLGIVSNLQLGIQAPAPNLMSAPRLPTLSRGPPQLSGGPPQLLGGPPQLSAGYPPRLSGGPPSLSGGPPRLSGPPGLSRGPPNLTRFTSPPPYSLTQIPGLQQHQQQMPGLQQATSLQTLLQRPPSLTQSPAVRGVRPGDLPPLPTLTRPPTLRQMGVPAPTQVGGPPMLRDPRTGAQLRFQPPKGWGASPRASSGPLQQRMHMRPTRPPNYISRFPRVLAPSRFVLPPPPRRDVQTHFVANSSGILIPVLSSNAVRLRDESPVRHRVEAAGLRAIAPAPPTEAEGTLRKVYLCPTCRIRFPVPEPDPEINFKGNFSCHVLFKHLRAEVETELGAEDQEVCPAEDCEYNIVQLREDGVPDAETFLIKHYIEKHLEVLLPLLQEHPLYSPDSCLKTISIVKPNTQAPTMPPKLAGMPNNKLKPIFTDKYFKFAKSVAKCEDLSQCDPSHVVMFLGQWTSRRNYSLAGIRTLVHWISEVHSHVDGRPLYFHAKIVEFVRIMENRLLHGQPGSGGLQQSPPATLGMAAPVLQVKSFYSPVISSSSDLNKATRCRFCNDQFPHATKLLYHMLHLHKANPVHFICKYLRSKPVDCPTCSAPCMSPVIFALHIDLHKKDMDCSKCGKQYSSVVQMYTDDVCGDNAIPKNVKLYVNSTVERLAALEEDTEIVGENFSLHYTKYAKRPLMQDLPMDYRGPVGKKSSPEKSRRRRYRDRKRHRVRAERDYIPQTVEEWVINIPTMLDARVAISMNDREFADTALEEQYDVTYEEREAGEAKVEGDEEPASKRRRLAMPDMDSYRCTICSEEFAAAWSLNVHYRTRHTEKQFSCSVCSKHFATITDLEQHSLVHKMTIYLAPSTPNPSSSLPRPAYRPSPKSRRVRPSQNLYMSSPSASPVKGPPDHSPPKLVKEPTYICEDCDGCVHGCTHEEHSLKLRLGTCTDHVLETGHLRSRDSREIRVQTDCRIQLLTLTYSPVYGNKIRKLWKVLAKTDQLTGNSYEFDTPRLCKVRDCEHYSDTAMDLFRHIREMHLTTIKKLNIKIGAPPPAEAKRSGRRPGPRSRTKRTTSNPFPFLLGAEATEEEISALENPPKIEEESAPTVNGPQVLESRADSASADC